MKFSSALTLTTVVSIMSSVHGAPVPSSEPVHYRRHSSVSELTGRQLQGNIGASNFMESFGAAFEPGNGIGKLLNFVKRQIGATNTLSQATHPSGASSSSGETVYNPKPEYVQTDNAEVGGPGLMGGGNGIDIGQSSGFAFEPGQAITL